MIVNIPALITAESPVNFAVVVKTVTAKMRRKEDGVVYDKVFKQNQVFSCTNEQAKYLANFPVKIYDANSFMLRYNHLTETQCNNVLLICGGGIGDILAHSALCMFLSNKNIHFFTEEKNYDVFKWFAKPVNLISMNGPVFNDWSFKNVMIKYKNWRRVKTEVAVLLNNSIDWYQVLFGCIGVEQADSNCFRPQLNQNRITEKPSNICHDNALLICNQSSCMMRNIEFDEIYKCLSTDIKENYSLYAYSNNLSEADKKRMELGQYHDVKFIKANSLGDFLLDLYDAKQVVTVDSSAIHFREGISKPAIGLYNSFPKEIRTSFYKFTKSFNIKSECDKQPCCKHELQLGDLCEKVSKWQYSAPCFRSISNHNLTIQLQVIFNSNL